MSISTHRRVTPGVSTLVAFATVLLVAPAFAQTSELWGVEGELFDPYGRLMDWCYAGYHAAEEPLPDLAPTLSVTDHGAVADDDGDDTAAFRDAIDAASGGGVISIPAGRFIIQDKLTLTDGVVLQGAGPGVTILDIPVSLTDVYGNPGLDGGGTSTYSFGQGFIEVRGNMPNTALAAVVTNASRGDVALELSATDGLSVGQWVRIVQTDVGGELIDRLHADLQQGGDDNVGDRGMDFHARVTAINGSSIEIDRNLPVDVDTAWSPEVLEFDPSATEIGVEHLTIEFPVTTYPGHFDEQGYNAIDFYRAVHSWVRDVEVLNSDYGVNVRTCFFVTVEDVILDTTGDRGSVVGHHGLNNGHGGDNLFIGFDIRATFQHDLTNEWYATGVVFTKGRGDNLRMDHHRAAPYQTLWTELDTGAGTTPWVSGGSGNRGPHTAAYDTMWNVQASADMELPADDYGPRMNFVGFQTAATDVTSPYEWWFEAIPSASLEPPNLWEAMCVRRFGPVDPGEGGGGAGGGDAGHGGSGGGGGLAGGSGGAPAGATPGSGLEGDCGCRAPGRRSGGGALWALGWLTAAALGRRRPRMRWPRRRAGVFLRQRSGDRRCLWPHPTRGRSLVAPVLIHLQALPRQRLAQSGTHHAVVRRSRDLGR